jgi:hypothetical protein
VPEAEELASKILEEHGVPKEVRGDQKRPTRALLLALKLTIEEWAQALDLKTPQVDSAATPVDQLQKLFSERTLEIRGDVEQFIRGTAPRVDLLSA